MGRTFRAPEDVVSKAAYISDITEEIQDVLTVEDLAVDEAPILLFKPTASAKPATARGRRLRLRTVLQAAIMAIITGPPVAFWSRPMTRTSRRIR
jgi:hypothetical protein